MYSIKEISSITGFTPVCLRQWENRYGLCCRGRSHGGHRRYSEADLSRLLVIKSLLAAGYKIGRIARLSDEERHGLSGCPSTDDGLSPTSMQAAEIFEALRQHQPERVDVLLGASFSALPPVEFMSEIVVPVMNKVGSGWADGSISIGQEHLFTGALSRLMIAAAHANLRLKETTDMVVTTPPRETHEIGALGAAYVATGVKANVTYIGPNLPGRDAGQIAGKLNAKVIATSASLSRADDDLGSYLWELDEAAPAGCEIWLGGSGLRSDILNDAPTSVRVFEGYAAFESAAFELHHR